ncbi:40S ribosomal protein S5-1 [Hordeum vulgare]|nr:40S ribosomal protein S5-1 [Hordeum vulgare]
MIAKTTSLRIVLRWIHAQVLRPPSDPGIPSSHGFPKDDTRTRRKLNSDEEDLDFVPVESALQKQKQKPAVKKTVRKEYSKPYDMRAPESARQGTFNLVKPPKKAGVKRFSKRTIHVIGRQTSMYEDRAETAAAEEEEDKNFEKVINPYLTEVLKHPQSIKMSEGIFHIRDVEGAKKTESMETRLEAMEQQVFKCQGMVECGLNANHMMITEFTSNHKMDAIDIGKHLSRLYDRVDQLQGQIYDL